MKCWNEAEFDHQTNDKDIVRSVIIYPLLSFKFMKRNLNVPKILIIPKVFSFKIVSRVKIFWCGWEERRTTNDTKHECWDWDQLTLTTETQPCVVTNNHIATNKVLDNVNV